MITGAVSEIQRFSLHDGPGIRTTVFFKGCQLRCQWCHNPETLSSEKEILRYKNKCTGCGICATMCPAGINVYDKKCVRCGKCIDSCPSGALKLAGNYMSVEDVVNEILEDDVFYGTSGGVTLSGGEPILQTEFAGAVLKECRHLGINTAIETNLAYPWLLLDSLLPSLDIVIFDMKIWDNEKHIKYTGRSNREILDNIKKLGGTLMRVIVRTPLIKGINDTDEDIEPIAEFLSNIENIEYYELLEYHVLGNEKYPALGLPAPAFTAPDRNVVNDLSKSILKYPLKLMINGERIES